MTLHPTETKHKALISSTSRFVGEFATDGLLLKYAIRVEGEENDIADYERALGLA